MEEEQEVVQTEMYKGKIASKSVVKGVRKVQEMSMEECICQIAGFFVLLADVTPTALGIVTVIGVEVAFEVLVA